jgi:hypothetical protein
MDSDYFAPDIANLVAVQPHVALFEFWFRGATVAVGAVEPKAIGYSFRRFALARANNEIKSAPPFSPLAKSFQAPVSRLTLSDLPTSPFRLPTQNSRPTKRPSGNNWGSRLSAAPSAAAAIEAKSITGGNGSLGYRARIDAIRVQICR